MNNKDITEQKDLPHINKTNASPEVMFVYGMSNFQIL